jgi:hypothetical protein
MHEQSCDERIIPVGPEIKLRLTEKDIICRSDQPPEMRHEEDWVRTML